jgi:hypothetical protein
MGRAEHELVEAVAHVVVVADGDRVAAAGVAMQARKVALGADLLRWWLDASHGLRAERAQHLPALRPRQGDDLLLRQHRQRGAVVGRMQIHLAADIRPGESELTRRAHQVRQRLRPADRDADLRVGRTSRRPVVRLEAHGGMDHLRERLGHRQTCHWALLS